LFVVHADALTMEETMSESSGKHRSMGSPFDAIADWVTRYRQAVGVRRELTNYGSEEVAAIARDIGLSAQELEFIASKGPHAAAELPKLLRALGVDPQELPTNHRTAMRDLQRLCITCGLKAQCRHELAAGTAAKHYRNYCPNAMSIDELFGSAPSH
jgi:hypothetical protein